MRLNSLTQSGESIESQRLCVCVLVLPSLRFAGVCEFFLLCAFSCVRRGRVFGCVAAAAAAAACASLVARVRMCVVACVRAYPALYGNFRLQFSVL